MFKKTTGALSNHKKPIQTQRSMFAVYSSAMRTILSCFYRLILEIGWA